MFDVAVILINYNSSRYTINCIKSIIEKTSPSVKYQIIITDNCSEKDDYILLENFCNELNFQDLRLFRSDINMGFGGGNMQGVQFAKAKYLAFINNDTTLKNDCLSILKNEMENNSKIGIATGQAFQENGNFLISIDHFASFWREVFGRKFLESINKDRYPKRKKIYAEPVKTEFVSGAFMFLQASDFYEVGGFDTNIFLYYEETDLCKRLLKNKKYAFLIPSAEYVHIHGASTKKSLEIKKELKISLLYVIRKHYGVLTYAALLMFLQLRYFFTSIFRPKYWSLFYLLLTGASLTKSIKQKQIIKTVITTNEKNDNCSQSK